MRLMIVIAGLLLAANALAEEKPKTVVKQLDKSSPLLMSTTSSDDSTEATGAKENFDRSKPHAVSPRDAASGMATGKRQHAPAAPGDGGDYNSSRSNKTHALSRSCGNGVDNDCDDVVDDAPANHNTTRSNRTLRATRPGGGATGQSRGHDYNSSRSNNTNGGEANPAGGGGGQGGTRAQDYNSSRSNTTSLRLDDDSDGDSLEEVRCSMRSDECVDSGNNDPVVRKKPGR